MTIGLMFNTKQKPHLSGKGVKMFEKYMHQDYEQWILGYFMNHNDSFGNFPNLETKHFLWQEHQKLFDKMRACYEKGLPFVFSKLGIEDEKQKEYVSKLVSCCDMVVNIKGIVEDLITESEKYYALEELYKLIKLAQEESDVDVFGTVSSIAIQTTGTKQPTSVQDMLAELYDKMAGKEVGISTGIDGLDDCMNGFQKGRLYVVGARSGMGKSAFMCSLVEKMEKTKRIGIISLEMLDKELKQRIACIRAKIPHWKIEKGRCSEEEASKYGETLYTINNLFINDEGGMKRANVLSAIRKMVKKQKCDIVFIDHIGLIRVNSNQNLAHEIGENTSALKAIAKELNIPIVALCQINRSAENGNEKMPSLSQLRDSGRIEEDADCVILLYREGYYQQQEQEQELCKYKIAKCRNGKRAIVDGLFTSSLMLFE